MAAKEIDTLDKCRDYFDSATFLANKELNLPKGNPDTIATSIIKEGVTNALFCTDLKYLEDALLVL